MSITPAQLASILGAIIATGTIVYTVAEFGVPAKSTDLKIVQSNQIQIHEELDSSGRRIDRLDNEVQAIYNTQQLMDNRLKNIEKFTEQSTENQIKILQILQQQVNR